MTFFNSRIYQHRNQMMKIKKLLLAIVNSRLKVKTSVAWFSVTKNELSVSVSGTNGIKRATWSQFRLAMDTGKRNNNIVIYTCKHTDSRQNEVRQRKISINLNTVIWDAFGRKAWNLIFKCDTQERVQTYRCVSQPISGNKMVNKRLVPLLLRLISVTGTINQEMGNSVY